MKTTTITEIFENMGGNTMVLERHLQLDGEYTFSYSWQGKLSEVSTDNIYITLGDEYIAVAVDSMMTEEQMESRVITGTWYSVGGLIDYDDDELLISLKDAIEDMRWEFIKRVCKYFNTLWHVDYTIIPIGMMMMATDFHLQMDPEDVYYETDGVTVTNIYQ